MPTCLLQLNKGSRNTLETHTCTFEMGDKHGLVPIIL